MPGKYSISRYIALPCSLISSIFQHSLMIIFMLVVSSGCMFFFTYACPSRIDIGLRSCKCNLITCANVGCFINGTRNSKVHLVQESISVPHCITKCILTLLFSSTNVLAKQLHRRCACQATFGTSSDRDTLNTVDKQLSTSSYSCCLSIFRHSLLLTHLIIFVYHFFTILTFEHASLLSLFSNPISCEIDAILIYWGNIENAWHEGTCTQ